MEFAFCRCYDGKPRELMTPSSKEGVFYAHLYFGNARWRTRNWRAIASGFIAERVGESFPLGTLVVNVTGSFVIGFFAVLTAPEGPALASPRFRQFFMMGLCGGYTTFSSFSLQTLDLLRDGDWLKASLNTMLSFACCLGAVWLGRILALTLLPK